MAEAQRQKQPRYEDNSNKNNNNDGKCEMQTALTVRRSAAQGTGQGMGAGYSGTVVQGGRGQWLLVGDKNRIGRRGQGAASQTFASEYVKCFGKCVPNVVDERAVVARGARGVHRKRFARSRSAAGVGERSVGRRQGGTKQKDGTTILATFHSIRG